MLISLAYVLVRRVLELVALRFRSHDFKELEIVVLRHELAILRRQTRRPALTTSDRILFGGRKPTHAAYQLAFLHRHAGHAPRLAPPTRGQAMDVRRSPGATRCSK